MVVHVVVAGHWPETQILKFGSIQTLVHCISQLFVVKLKVGLKWCHDFDIAAACSFYMNTEQTSSDQFVSSSTILVVTF